MSDSNLPPPTTYSSVALPCPFTYDATCNKIFPYICEFVGSNSTSATYPSYDEVCAPCKVDWCGWQDIDICGINWCDCIIPINDPLLPSISLNVWVEGLFLASYSENPNFTVQSSFPTKTPVKGSDSSTSTPGPLPFVFYLEDEKNTRPYEGWFQIEYTINGKSTTINLVDGANKLTDLGWTWNAESNTWNTQLDIFQDIPSTGKEENGLFYTSQLVITVMINANPDPTDVWIQTWMQIGVELIVTASGWYNGQTSCSCNCPLVAVTQKKDTLCGKYCPE